MDIPNGSYYIWYKIDADDYIDESDENNNVWYFTTPITINKYIDLTIYGNQNINYSSNNLTFTNAIINNGNSAAFNFNISYYAKSLSGTYTYLGNKVIDYLGAGQTINLTFTKNICNTNLSNNYYYFEFDIDGDEDIDESNENNNNFITTYSYYKNCGVDLKQQYSNSASIVFSNNILNINTTIINSGTDNSGPFSIGYYLSDNSSFNNYTYFLGYNDINNLGANLTFYDQFSKNLCELNIPNGTYYAGYFVDNFEEVNETDENNTWYWANTLIIRNCLTTYTIYSSYIGGGYIYPLGFTSVNNNSNQTYTITPFSGFYLDSLLVNGVKVNNSNSYTFNSISKNNIIKAIFKPLSIYSVSLSSNPANSGTTSGSGNYNAGSSVSVTATPNSGYVFTNWTENGTAVSSNASYTFTINANRTLVANFTQQTPSTYSVSLSSNPANSGTTSGAGNYNAGSSVSVTATPNSGYVFTNWTENGTVVSSNASYTFTINANRTLVANFTQQTPSTYSVSLSSNPANSGTTSGSGNYNAGSSVSLTATPNSGYVFTNWTENGNAVSSNASYTFTINANRTLVANFTQQTPSTYSVSLSSNPANSGTTSGAGNYNAGSSVSVTATPNSGYVFTSWTENGTAVSSNASYTFTINANRTLVATFRQQAASAYSVSLSTNPANSGTTSGSGNYNAGSSITVTATPNSGYEFTNWTENGTAVSTNASYTFTINANRTLVANFTLCPNLETPIIARVNNNLQTNIQTYSKYEWYKDNIILNGYSTYLLQSPNIGVYTVKGFNQNLCPTNLSKKYYYATTCITPTGRIGNGASIEGNVIDNPSQIIIKWCPEILKNFITILALDINGNKVLQQKVPANLGTYILFKNTINATQYFIQVLDENNELVQLSDVVNIKN